jgi:hypothetical protein
VDRERQNEQSDNPNGGLNIGLVISAGILCGQPEMDVRASKDGYAVRSFQFVDQDIFENDGNTDPRIGLTNSPVRRKTCRGCSPYAFLSPSNVKM